MIKVEPLMESKLIVMLKIFGIRVMENSLKETGSRWFETPKEVVKLSIDPTTGHLASDNCEKKVTLYYERGNLPTITCFEDHNKSSILASNDMTND